MCRVSVSVSTLLYRHQWNVCILSQTCLYCIGFMLLMWAFVHDVSVSVSCHHGDSRDWSFEVMMSSHWSPLSFPRPQRKGNALPARPIALVSTEAEVLSEILTDVTEQDQNGAFPHSTAVLQQVQVLQQGQTHTLDTWIKWPMNSERTVFQAS